MSIRYILSEYLDQAMARAVYDKLDDGSYSGHIPCCEGVLAFGETLKDCEIELRSTLEDWILLGLQLQHSLPVIANINLNKAPSHDSLGALQA